MLSITNCLFNKLTLIFLLTIEGNNFHYGGGQSGEPAEEI